MILHNRYLSDEELECLMMEAEADLIPAPPKLADTIQDLIQNGASDARSKGNELRESPQTVVIKKSKQKEFTAYCFRVSMAVAAAVVFVFVIPYLPGLGMSTGGTEPHMDMTGNKPEPLSEAQYAEYEALKDCPTRDEVLNDTNFLQKVFGEDGIFTENIDFNMLKEENGGQ